jgi:hypothetical protein
MIQWTNNQVPALGPTHKLKQDRCE